MRRPLERVVRDAVQEPQGGEERRVPDEDARDGTRGQAGEHAARTRHAPCCNQLGTHVALTAARHSASSGTPRSLTPTFCGAQGRREFGDVDTYDFKLQCSGVWQEYMDLSFSGEKAKGARECPAGTMAFGWRSYRGFVKRGDRDSYEFELNCKASSAVAGALRAMPNVQTLGLSQNVFVWSKHDVATWLGALGLGEHGEAFKMNNLQGDVIFLLLESHLQDLGMKKIGDRLYFMEVLTQLHDAVNSWSKMIGQSLSSTRTLPNLQRNGLPLQAGLAPGPGPGSSPSPGPGPAAVGVSIAILTKAILTMAGGLVEQQGGVHLGGGLGAGRVEARLREAPRAGRRHVRAERARAARDRGHEDWRPALLG